MLEKGRFCITCGVYRVTSHGPYCNSCFKDKQYARMNAPSVKYDMRGFPIASGEVKKAGEVKKDGKE